MGSANFRQLRPRCTGPRRNYHDGECHHKKEENFIHFFKITKLLYRKDRLKNLKTCLKKTIINKAMGWCDDARSKDYNKLDNAINLAMRIKPEKHDFFIKPNMKEFKISRNMSVTGG